jgi:hypothetical protein
LFRSAFIRINPRTKFSLLSVPGGMLPDMQTGLGLNTPPAIRIAHSAGMTYSIQIAPRATAYGNADAPVTVNIFDPGFLIRLTNLVLNTPVPQPIPFPASASVQATATTADLSDLMNLNLDPDAKRIAFDTGADDAETPSISLAVSQADGSDYSIEVKNVNVYNGHAVALAFNEASQSATIEDNFAGETNYAVEVTRVNTNGTQDTFVSAYVSDDGAAAVTLHVGPEWVGGTPEITVDATGTLPAPTFVDDDNDGQSNADELACGSDPLNPNSVSPDSDGDNIPDCVENGNHQLFLPLIGGQD